MKDSLSNDEYDALSQLAAGIGQGRPSACVARNVKRLAGLKFVAYGRDGALSLTEKGVQTLFLRDCVLGMRAIMADPMAPLRADVMTFLAKKGHMAARGDQGGYELTVRGQESLADIDKAAG